MATLIFSTVGSALGGPVGGAIGALIGQSFDQQLLAPARRGPRLGDLAVQTSTYGTQVPRIYGSMRVAGSVVWATDLVESEQMPGAKGQPDVVYSYSVSLAVALSSRPGSAIGRIWADGKLLRGAAGDFKVETVFRFHDGSESQEIDPLIASIEGIANTPAYRGMALALFENLQLAEFGNRIPFMTFELIADAGPVRLDSILADCSDGVIQAEAAEPIAGYAAYGRSVASAVQPLVGAYDLALFDDGETVRSPAAGAAVLIEADELGSTPDTGGAPAIEQEQVPVEGVPSTLKLSFYDPARDYQTGEARALAGERGGSEAQHELPAVLSVTAAKSLVDHMLARQWQRRDRMTLRLPPSRILLDPGTLVVPPIGQGAWRVQKCTVDGLALVAELRRQQAPAAIMPADGGRFLPNLDVVAGPLSLALFEGPSVTAEAAAGPVMLIAASCETAGWKIRPLTISAGGQTSSDQTAQRKSLLGTTLTALGAAGPDLIDEQCMLEVELVDSQQWLTSCDMDALAAGTNLAMVGQEYLQFMVATPIGQGRFRLSRLLRGRGGSEWAIAGHVAGEHFCLFEPAALRQVPLAPWLRGTSVSVSASTGSPALLGFEGLSAIVPQPAHLKAERLTNGDLAIRWIRRSRSGLAWIDEVDAPLGETRELYRVNLSIGSSSREVETATPGLTLAAAELAPFGSGALLVEVRQLGDFAASRPASLTVTL